GRTAHPELGHRHAGRHCPGNGFPRGSGQGRQNRARSLHREETLTPPTGGQEESGDMHWILLAAAIVFEISGTTCMKLSEGFTKPLPTVGIFVFYVASISCLTLAVRVIDISVAYAIWSAVGVAV